MKLIQWAFYFSILTVSFAGQADVDTKIDGSGRLRFESVDNKDFNDGTQDRDQFTGSRFRLGVELKSNELTSIYIQAQYTDIWGRSSGKLSDNVMTVHQAYIKHQLSDSIELKLGRQELAYGEHLLVGNVGWSNVGRSFDAAKLKYTHSLGWVDLFTSEVSTATKDNSFSGLYVSFNKLNLADEIDFYTFYSENPAGLLDTNVLHYGARLKSKRGKLDYRFEATGQTEVSGHQADLEVGYTASEDTKMKFLAEVFTASEDYIQLYPTAHKWLGIGDLLSRRNINGIRLGFEMKVRNTLKVLTGYQVFYRQDSSAPSYGFDGAPLGIVGDSKDIGSELGVLFNYKLDEKNSIVLGGSLFIVGDHLKENSLGDNNLLLFTQLHSKF